jgi:hypothetical protein
VPAPRGGLRGPCEASRLAESWRNPGPGPLSLPPPAPQTGYGWAPIFRHPDTAQEDCRRQLLLERRKALGAVRVSLGIASTFADVHHVLCFVRGFLDRASVEVPDREAVPG